VPVEPMYMPGRLRTASRPSRTVMSFAPYVDAACFGSFFANWVPSAGALHNKAPKPSGSRWVGAGALRASIRIAAAQTEPGAPNVTKCPQIAPK